MQLKKITLTEIILSVMVSIPYLSQIASSACTRMIPSNNLRVNLTECKLKTFAGWVPTYFCIEYCDSLPDCLAVAMEIGKMTSWCCAFGKSNINVCEGNQTIISSPGVQLFLQNVDICKTIGRQDDTH